MRAEIAICEGGACSRNGAALLLGACAALGGADLRVVGSACTSKCPSRGVVLSNSGVQSVVPASYAAQALESALSSANSVLAQASMAPALAECGDIAVPIMTSPRSGLEAAVKVVRERSAAP